MLLACRLAGLSALEAHYAGVVAPTQTEPSVAPSSVKSIDGGKRHVKAIRAAATTTSASVIIALAGLQVSEWT
jgi:hypothetical protein